MRKITSALLFCAYLFLAMTVAALVARSGAGWGAGIAALTGVLGALLSIHVLVSQGSVRAGLEREIDAVREAHRLLADALEGAQGTLSGLAGQIEHGALANTEQLTDEVRMLEDLVHRMGVDLEARLSGIRHQPPETHEGRRTRQTAALLETVREALAENRVDLYLQPVVSLPQRRTVFYESFSRLRDETGRVMMPAEYLSVAEIEGLVSAIDNLLLFRCVQIVRRLAKQDRKVGIFCNVSPASLSDEAFFPQFLEFLADNRDLAGALIFELGQAAFDARGSIEARNMARLADLGFQFSIDKVQTLDLDFTDLQRSDVKFVKISADLLLEQLLDVEGAPALSTMKDIHAGDFAELTRRYGIELVVEKVESERQVVDILDLDIAYGQGHLFGEPRAIKEQVLAETDPPNEYIRSTLHPRRGRRYG
ncbi:MAG TPA: EAL domain-containing protein [Caulobacteraceae bacterium]|jgi:cyclic-di-GMP phosphodiesterase TipF (flagellum assembly factor)